MPFHFHLCAQKVQISSRKGRTMSEGGRQNALLPLLTTKTPTVLTTHNTWTSFTRCLLSIGPTPILLRVSAHCAQIQSPHNLSWNENLPMEGGRSDILIIHYKSSILFFYFKQSAFGKAMYFVYHVKFWWKDLNWISSQIYNHHVMHNFAVIKLQISTLICQKTQVCIWTRPLWKLLLTVLLVSQSFIV